MRILLGIAAAASALVLAAAGSVAQNAGPTVVRGSTAQPAATAAPTPAPTDSSPAGRVGQVPANGPPILLEAGRGTLIRLPRPASTVFIANPDIADVQIKSPSLIYVSAKAPGETALYAVDSDDRVLLNAPVRVEHDLSRVRQSINTLAPGENVQVSSVDNSLVLSGNVSSAGRAEKVRSLAASIVGATKGTVVNRLSVATPNQVNIRVKVAEVDRNVLKAIGINWNNGGSGSKFQFNTDNPVTGGQILTSNLLQYAVPVPGSNGTRIEATLDALAQEGLLTTLAEPNLTATNGQPATFLAGGEFPIPVAVSPGSGVTTISIEFKTFGVSLDVTPTIIDADHLNLRIRPEVSQLSSQGAVTISGFSIPALTVRRAETTVELGSGESFALAGLLENTATQNISKVPALGDIPIIGQLFRSQQFQRNETELVIIVTPYLVKPTVTSLATPVDGYIAPHDAQQIISGGTYRQTLPGPAKGPVGAGGRGLVGTAGFRLD
ncbi:MAG TPA: type II and III secretion system protein family protein [Stellaceae bacterium]|jgi:pilus assembly protein CpaC|nr:type II and III secretion system protein family protein [Stellaceae bacterium]